MREVAIVNGARTPFGRGVKGVLRDTRPDTLAVHAMKAVLAKNPQVKKEDVEDIVLGCAFPEASRA